jgi:3-deoxy-D-manno-octulosonic-acid transferase
MIGALYRLATAAAGPWLEAHLAHRAAAGKEDPARLSERKGIAGRPRPAGPLLWLHGASVGETLALLPLIGPVARARPGLHLLVTSGTRSAATLLGERLPATATHQYLPLDRAEWVARFLDHWRPDAGIFADSELWPNLLAAAKARAIPLALVNARLSARSFRRWRLAGSFARELLGAFDVVLALDAEQARRFQVLGARRVEAVGNLKAAAAPPPCDENELARFETACAGRPVLLLASTHDGEETALLAAAAGLRPRHPQALLLIAPRHPERGAAIAQALVERGLAPSPPSCRSAGELPSPSAPLYLADSLGEMGLWYRLADLVVMGGSLVPKGGHNPIEPAGLGLPILTGPQIQNFAELYRRLAAAGGARVEPDAPSIMRAAEALLADPAARARMGAAAREVAEAEARVLDRALAALAPVLGGLTRRDLGQQGTGRAGA